VEILGSGYRKRIDRAAKQWYLQVVHEDIERQLVKTAVKEMCNEWLHVLTEPVIAESKALDQRFREQAEKWAAETAHMSSPTQMMMHPSYQAVLGMAQENKREVIRLLILDLQEHRRTWFWALSYITHDNPINPSDAGKMGKMIDAWVKWGKAQGVI
jgi:hypothetical protein